MQPLLSVSFATVAIVLVAAGASKLLRPAPTMGALGAMRLPASAGLVRAIGLLEVGIGAAALLLESWVPAALVAAAYAAFVVFVAAALRRGTYLQTCGCFGGLEVPPTRIHLVVDAVAALLGVAALIVAPEVLVDLVASEALAGIPLLVVVATAAFLVVATLTVLPLAMLAVTGETHGRTTA